MAMFKRKNLRGFALAVVLVAGLTGCPATRITMAVPTNAVALVIDADPQTGLLSAGQTAWYKFGAAGQREYTVAIDSNAAPGTDAGLDALSQAYYEKVTDARGNPILQTATTSAKSVAVVTPEADRELYVQLTNDFPETVTADVNYTIAVTLKPDPMNEGEVGTELKVTDDPTTVDYTQATLQSGTPTWVKFTSVKGANLHLDVKGDAKISAVYASDHRTPVSVDASLLNILDLPSDGEYFIALSTDLATQTVLAGLIRVSVNPTSFAEITTVWTPSSPAVQTSRPYLKEAKTWVQFSATIGQNLFAGSKDGTVIGTAYQSDLVTPVNLNNIPATGTYALALHAISSSYLSASTGLERVSAVPTSAAEVSTLLSVTTESALTYTPVVLTANGATWVKFNGMPGGYLQFTARPYTAQLTAVYLPSGGVLGDPVDAHALPAQGVYVAQLRSISGAARSEVEVALYW